MREVIRHTDVIKVGTNALVRKHEDGSESLNYETFRRIGRVASAGGEGRPAVIVSSGAITAGMIATGTKKRPGKTTQMPELQRLASVGWGHILHAWDSSIKLRNTGGVLLTQQELNRSEERDEAIQVIHTLLSHGEVPIVNENDTISHSEIAFGDNDTLAATLAVSMAHSELFGNKVRLFLLGDTNGVYADKDDPDTRIPVITDTADYLHLAEGSDSEFGTGGMVTKFAAADIAKEGGVDMWIYKASRGNPNYALRGTFGTYFPA